MKKISVIIFSILALVSCTKVVSFDVPEAQRSYEFEAAGATFFATVSTTDFTVSCDAQWIYTEIYKGSRTHNLRITAGQNTKAVGRSAEITLTPLGSGAPIAISVHQSGASPFIKLIPGSLSLAIDDVDFTLSSVANCQYDIETPDWIEFASREEKEDSDTIKLHFKLVGTVTLGESRSGNVVLKSKEAATEATATAYIEQVGAKWETVTMTWGLSDIQYIWQAFGKVTSAIKVTTVNSTDFSSYPRISVYAPGGFIYKNSSGDELYFVMSSDAEFKINKAGSKTSTGNINRDGENVERMQMNKATSGVGENCFMFIAPRSGSLEIEAASPNSGDKKPQIMVDGAKIDATFSAPYAIPSAVTTVPITVTSEGGAEVRIFGTGGAINYFQISYTYERPVLE